VVQCGAGRCGQVCVSLRQARPDICCVQVQVDYRLEPCSQREARRWGCRVARALTVELRAPGPLVLWLAAGAVSTARSSVARLRWRSLRKAVDGKGKAARPGS
jgi:hypothetical protein